ncbi:restriction endonuclease subunit S [uncultured Muribaculum sp.]|uniref:restriction endonuclease subunit S n=1 Tax=uncultured Muribaculum sp. TaxID=1918613 RepID=UPI0025A55B9D|nr:restriction endonuclease subunit S [uncultured Muribaculum sp.]
MLPNGWCFTDIGELLINRDGERKPVSSAIRSKQTNKIYDYYGAAGVIDKVDSYLFDERLLLVGEDGANLLSRSKNNAFFADGKYWVNNHAHVLDATNKKILDFVAIVINSMKLDDYITGSAQPKLSQDNLNKIPISLPPLAEQERITAEIERWFALIDQIEQGKSDLQATIKQAKSKILDLAIHGKLVPQDPNDEPAIELLKRINPDFTPCDNGHYTQLPDGWTIAPMEILCSLVDGCKQNGIERINLDVKYLRGERDAKTLISGKYVVANSLLILVDGENSGEVFITPIEGYQGSTFKQLSINDNLNTDYILQVINLHRKTLRENKVGSAIPHLNKKLFKAIEVPIPPYNEQQRIVEAINKAFMSLNLIMESL